MEPFILHVGSFFRRNQAFFWKFFGALALKSCCSGEQFQKALKFHKDLETNKTWSRVYTIFLLATGSWDISIRKKNLVSSAFKNQLFNFILINVFE